MSLKTTPRLLRILPLLAGLVLSWQLQAQPAAESPLPRLLGSTHVHGLAVDRRDPSRLLIATHHGLYTAGPEGPARLLSERQDDFMGFTPHPTDPLSLYASGHPATGGNLGFIASRDGGKSWQQLSPGVSGPVDFHQMDVSKSDPKVIYGNFGGLQVSRDGGLTWKRVGRPIGTIIDLAISSRDSSTLFVGTQEGLLISRDGGQTLQPGMLQTKPVTMVETTRDGEVYVFMYEVGLLRAREPELNWEKAGTGLDGQVLMHLASDPADGARLFAVAHGNVLLASTDRGKTWRRIAKP